MSTRKTSRGGSLKGSVGSISSIIEGETHQMAASENATPVEAPPKKSMKISSAKKSKPSPAQEKSLSGGDKPVQPFGSTPAVSTKSPKVTEFVSKLVKTSPTSSTSLDLTAFVCKQMEDMRAFMAQSQEQTLMHLQKMQQENEVRFANIEATLNQFVPAVDQRFNVVEQRVAEDEVGSQASINEINKVHEYLQQENAAGKGKEAAQDQEIASIEDYLVRNQTQEAAYRAELEAKIERLMLANQAQQAEIENLKKLNWSDVRNKPVPPPIQTHPIEASSSRPAMTTGVVKTAGGDVVMSEACPREHEFGVPKFDGETMDVKVFLKRLERYFNRYPGFYQTHPEERVLYIENHLEGLAQSWYNMQEAMIQAEDPQPERLMEMLRTEFKDYRTEDEVKNAMLKLRHKWGKAYEYLASFNRLSRILQLTDETKKLLLMQQVRPSVREEMYNLPQDRQTLDDYIACLRRCDTFPNNYKDEYLERHESEREREKVAMALLGMVDPRRPSQDIEDRKKKFYEGRKNKKEFKRKEAERHFQKNNENRSEAQKENVKENSTKYNNKYNSFRDSRTSSNNPLPKSALVVQPQRDPTNKEYVPEATIKYVRTNQSEEKLSVLYDTGSHINLIHRSWRKTWDLR